MLTSDGNKTLNVEGFIASSKIEPTYFDKPYYLLPSDDVAQETFILLREALRKQKVAAIAHAVLFRRVRPVLIRAHGKGLIAMTLKFDHEVRWKCSNWRSTSCPPKPGHSSRKI